MNGSIILYSLPVSNLYDFNLTNDFLDFLPLNIRILC